MNKNKSFLMSLKFALEGLMMPFLEERNLRIHFSFANLIIIFAYHFGITKTQWAILILTIAMVIFSELVNTAIENAVDTATREINKSAKIAKDTAAGAVLLCALTSIVMGFILFFDIERIQSTLTLIFTTPKILIPSLMVGIFDVLFIIFAKKEKS